MLNRIRYANPGARLLIGIAAIWAVFVFGYTLLFSGLSEEALIRNAIKASKVIIAVPLFIYIAIRIARWVLFGSAAPIVIVERPGGRRKWVIGAATAVLTLTLAAIMASRSEDRAYIPVAPAENPYLKLVQEYHPPPQEAAATISEAEAREIDRAGRVLGAKMIEEIDTEKARQAPDSGKPNAQP